MHNHLIKKYIRKLAYVLVGLPLVVLAGCEDPGEGLMIDPGTDFAQEVETIPESVGETEIEMIYVHVAGEVKNPGIYRIPVGSRLFAAIEAAGGFTGEAAMESVNLARLLYDGEQVYVYRVGEYNKEEDINSGGITKKINLNTANLQQLMTLPGIGQAKAQTILDYRNKNGSFATIEDVMKVAGIKEAAFEKIKEYITVGQ